MTQLAISELIADKLPSQSLDGTPSLCSPAAHGDQGMRSLGYGKEEEGRCKGEKKVAAVNNCGRHARSLRLRSSKVLFFKTVGVQEKEYHIDFRKAPDGSTNCICTRLPASAFQLRKTVTREKQDWPSGHELFYLPRRFRSIHHGHQKIYDSQV
jgi:hypothetical protein